MTSQLKKAIVVVAEDGYLADQAKLLVKSIRRISEFSGWDVLVYSPRPGLKISKKDKKELERLGAAVNGDDLNIKHSFLPHCNGIYACAHAEETLSPQTTLLLDTDTLFAKYIPSEYLERRSIWLRAVDNKGVGSTGINDANDEFWRDVFSFFSLDLPPPNLSTTVRTELIRPYYNSGFVLVNRINGFFNQWLKDFTKIMDSGIRVKNFRSRFKDNFSFMEQMVLSVTTERFKELINLVDNRVNYPIPFHPYLRKRDRHCEISELIHIHYHKWFQHPGFLDYIFSEPDRESSFYAWIKEQLPLKPIIDGPFKT